MKILIFFAPLLFIFQFVIGQVDSTNEYFNPANLPQIQKEAHGNWGINAGAFGVSYNGKGYFGSFLAPNYNVDLTKKFSVRAGIIFSTFQSPAILNAEDNLLYNNSFGGTFFYTQGTYKINNKIFLTGGVYTSLMRPNVANNINPAFYNNVKGGKAGIGYNINEHSGLYFEMQFNKGMSPFNSYSSPFSNNYENLFIYR